MTSIKSNSKFYCCFIIIVIFLSSCAKENELFYISYERPDNLIPIFNMNEESKYLSELIFDGLVNKTTVNKEGKEEYEWALVSEGGYQEESLENRFLLSIYLKKGVKWHHGEEVTAKDVIYTWNSIQQSNSPLKGWLSSFIEGISLIEGENYKFKIKLKVERSKEAFMELFAPVKILPHRILVNDEFVEMPYDLNTDNNLTNSFKWNPIGTGPYIIDERKSESIDFKANTKYRDGTPQIEAIKYLVEKDRIMAVKTLSTTQQSILFNVNPESFNVLGQSNLIYESYVPYSFYVIAYNTNNEPFSDIYFRKAINSSTNKEELANVFFDDVTMNTNQYVNTSIFPSNSRYVKGAGADFIDSTPYNLSNTRSNLDRSAINSGSFNLLVSSIIDSENRIQSFVAAYSKQMEEAGINVTIDDASSPVYYQKIRDRSFDAVLIHLTGFDHFYDIRGLFRPGGERNIWGIDDGELNNELVEFGNTISWDKLLGITSNIHKRVEELSPGCFIFTVPRRCYYSNKISDITVHPEVGFSTVENWKYKSK